MQGHWIKSRGGLLATNDVRWREPIGNVTENSSSRSRSRKRRGHEPGERVLLLLGSLFVLIIVAIGCGAPARVRPTSLPSQVEEPTEVRIAESEPMSEDTFVFAMSLPVPQDKAIAGNVDEIRTTFRSLRELGINIVVQPFDPRSSETDWKAYLDAAMQEDMKAIGGIRRGTPAWDGHSCDLGINRVFLESMKDHPALYAFFMVDEPFHWKHEFKITAETLQLLYQQAKEIAPNVPVVVQFSREIQKAEEKQVPPRFAFKRGMCDICVISALEFRNEGQGDLFYSDDLVSNHTISRAVIRREEPDAKIWTVIQVFGSIGVYYMPSADESQQMIDLLLSPELQAAGELDGIIWHHWASRLEALEAEQHTLGDPEFEALRNVVKETAKDLDLLK
jgi:hypothetical protein